MNPLEAAKKLNLQQIANLLVLAKHQGEMLEQHAAKRKQHTDKLEQQETTIEQKDTCILNLVRRNNWLINVIRGATSERRTLKHLTPSQQLFLGEQFLEPSPEPPASTTTVGEHERQKRKRGINFRSEDSRLKFDDSVPTQIIVVPNPELEGVPESELQLIDTRRTYRLAQRSSAYVILEYVQHVYKRKGADKPTCPPVPPAIYEKSSADVSFLANLLVDKFQYHLPLHRQHQRLVHGGIFMDRSTLTRLFQRTGQLLEPIYHTLLSSILNSQVLTMDESPTPAGRTKGTADKKGKINSGYFWVLHGDKQEVVFVYSPSRARAVINELLTGFNGTLLTDGYKPYASFVKDNPGVRHGQCWAHTRRKFIEAEKFARGPCTKVIRLLQELYKVERRAKGDPAALARLRDLESRPIIEVIFKFLKEEMDRTALLPSNPYVVAASYALDREEELRVFLDDHNVPVDTNHIERALRPAAIGRKNWMFHITEEGARYAGICYSVIQSCLMADVDPCVYLIDILQRVSIHPADQVHLLRPQEWKQHFGANPLRSDLQG